MKTLVAFLVLLSSYSGALAEDGKLLHILYVVVGVQTEQYMPMDSAQACNSAAASHNASSFAQSIRNHGGTYLAGCE
jgi:hypothetical protein